MVSDIAGRLDSVLCARKLYPSRAKAVAAIRSGLVRVNGIRAKRPSMSVSDTDKIIARPLPFESGRGRLKLDHALSQFKVSPNGYKCIDVGASTGGFTESLLASGASKIIAVEIGKNQMTDTLKNDSRVISMEETDIKNIERIESVDLIVIDVSFISLTQIIDAVARHNSPRIITLIKPQFEVASDVARRANGIIKNNVYHNEAIENVIKKFAEYGYIANEVIDSPILGGSGNKEFLAYFTLAKD